MAKQFQQFLDATNALNKDMHNALVQFVKSKGGFIDMSDNTAYAYIINEFWDETQEARIVAIRLNKDEQLEILVEYDENLYDTIEEMLASKDWYSIFGGFVLQNATLYSLCETLNDND